MAPEQPLESTHVKLRWPQWVFSDLCQLLPQEGLCWAPQLWRGYRIHQQLMPHHPGPINLLAWPSYVPAFSAFLLPPFPQNPSYPSVGILTVRCSSPPILSNTDFSASVGWLPLVGNCQPNTESQSIQVPLVPINPSIHQLIKSFYILCFQPSTLSRPGSSPAPLSPTLLPPQKSFSCPRKSKKVLNTTWSSPPDSTNPEMSWRWC